MKQKPERKGGVEERQSYTKKKFEKERVKLGEKPSISIGILTIRPEMGHIRSGSTYARFFATIK